MRLRCAEGFGGGADETPKIGPARPPLSPPTDLRSGGVRGNVADFDLILVAK